MSYEIVETSCYPNCYKIILNGIERNATYLFRPTYKEAEERAKRLDGSFKAISKAISENIEEDRRLGI